MTAFGRFAHGRDPVRITFAPAQFATGAATEYQTRLRGFDDRWSEWSQEMEREFLNPEGGPFTFEVRLRNEAGEVSPVASYRFDVGSPWYRTGWALAGYAGAAGLAFWGLLRWRLARARAEQIRLENLVALRTRELEQAKDLAEEANRAKSRFLANMSHELRTPLNGILGFAQILGRDADMNDRNRERLRIIRSSGDHLLGLINDVLDLAKVEAGRVELRPAPFSVRDQLRDLEASFAQRALQRGLKLGVSATDVTTTAVLGDAQRLRQVLENLLGNAIKFTRTGTVRLEVSRVPEAGNIRGILPVRRHRHRARPDAGGSGPPLPAVFPGRFRPATGTGRRPRARDQPASRRAHGRAHRGPQPTRRGQPLPVYHPVAGRRGRGARHDGAPHRRL